MLGSPLDTLLFDPKEFAFLTNYTFRGLTVSQSLDGWNVVLRAYGHDGKPLYAIATGNDAAEALKRLLGALATNNGAQLWRHDKYHRTVK